MFVCQHGHCTAATYNLLALIVVSMYEHLLLPSLHMVLSLMYNAHVVVVRSPPRRERERYDSPRRDRSYSADRSVSRSPARGRN